MLCGVNELKLSDIHMNEPSAVVVNEVCSHILYLLVCPISNSHKDLNWVSRQDAIFQLTRS